MKKIAYIIMLSALSLMAEQQSKLLDAKVIGEVTTNKGVANISGFINKPELLNNNYQMCIFSADKSLTKDGFETLCFSKDLTVYKSRTKIFVVGMPKKSDKKFKSGDDIKVSYLSKPVFKTQNMSKKDVASTFMIYSLLRASSEYGSTANVRKATVEEAKIQAEKDIGRE